MRPGRPGQKELVCFQHSIRCPRGGGDAWAHCPGCVPLGHMSVPPTPRSLDICQRTDFFFSFFLLFFLRVTANPVGWEVFCGAGSRVGRNVQKMRCGFMTSLPLPQLGDRRSSGWLDLGLGRWVFAAILTLGAAMSHFHVSTCWPESGTESFLSSTLACSSV